MPAFAATLPKTSRKRRRTVLRTTALPTFFETESPRRKAPSSFRKACTEKSFPLKGVPCLYTFSNSEESDRRIRLLRATRQTARRFRPRRRRAAMTLLPPTELMRLRKPWVFALLRRFGWYVRFIRLLYRRFRMYRGSEAVYPKPQQPSSQQAPVDDLRRAAFFCSNSRKILQTDVYLLILVRDGFISYLPKQRHPALFSYIIRSFFTRLSTCCG